MHRKPIKCRKVSKYRKKQNTIQQRRECKPCVSYLKNISGENQPPGMQEFPAIVSHAWDVIAGVFCLYPAGIFLRRIFLQEF